MTCRVATFAAVFALVGGAPLSAINLTVTHADIERALALSRWPHTDTERVRFHDPYLTILEPRMMFNPNLTAGSVTVEQLEIITEFRRLELIAESHVRLNDSFGRGGIEDAVEALRPWRGRVAIDAHLGLPNHKGTIPESEIALSGVGIQRAYIAHPPVIYAKTGLSPQILQGNIVEAVFDGIAVGQVPRIVTVIVSGRQVARVP